MLGLDMDNWIAEFVSTKTARLDSFLEFQNWNRTKKIDLGKVYVRKMFSLAKNDAVQIYIKMKTNKKFGFE